MNAIEAIIDKYLEPKPRERSGLFSPSSFGKCHRAQLWNRYNEPPSNPPEARSLRVFEAGRIFEKFVKQCLVDNDTGWVDCGDKAITTQPDIIGYADLDNPQANEVADVKSIHSKAFWYMVRCKGKDIRTEKRGNWLQVMYYARELHRKFGRLVFVSKDDLCIQEYVQPLDDYWRKELADEIATLRDWWDSGKLPPAKPQCKPRKDGTYWECDYCQWKDKCNDLEQGDKECH